jgi:membrane protease YdiL (CAAX protease family)
MTSRQIIALVAPLAIIVTMIPIFRVAAKTLGNRNGWVLGLAIYWLLWGAIFPLLLIGWENISLILRPQKLTTTTLFYVLIPIIIASLNKFFPSVGYEKSTKWAFVPLLLTAFGNGLFEEILWRGVYTNLFSNSILFAIILPSLCFALWHYAPGSISQGDKVLVLMAGAFLFGLYLSFVATKTGTIWWGVLGHTFAAIVMIL